MGIHEAAGWWGSNYGWQDKSWRSGGWDGGGWRERSDYEEEPPSLWEFVRADDAPSIRAALSRTKDPSRAANALDAKGWAPLHVAAMTDSAAAAEALLLHGGADVSARSGYLTPTALHLAAWHGHVAVARTLLNGRASPLALNGLGELPIEKAQQRGMSEAEALLLEFGSPPPAVVPQVDDKHAITALASAAARAAESDRSDALFFDPLAHRLATGQGRNYGDGMSWILTPRTVIGDRLLREQYQEHGIRQAVIVGAGMDARAYRLGLTEMHFFEVDQAAIFDVKEPLLRDIPLDSASRRAVPLDLCEPSPALVHALSKAGFNRAAPSCWLLEGIVMYLSPSKVEALMAQISSLAATGSVVVHDAVSQTSQQGGIQCCGARFLSGNDDYARLWTAHGFSHTEVVNFDAIIVDRRHRAVKFDPKYSPAPPDFVQGRPVTMFVRAEK